LNTADSDTFANRMMPGAPCLDAPLIVDGRDDWLLARLGDSFVLLLFADRPLDEATRRALAGLADVPLPLRVLLVGPGPLPAPPVGVSVVDHKGVAAARYDGQPGTCYLIRPDQHVAARWRALDPARIRAALARATAQEVLP
ncbi:MAG TPA: FAD-dependent oxidoreductase, partial [Candidatus Competibacteraceae bacterium]|nr:FAD-dependent oxidoreductase [Candidatus Competibacteraceae bacterium]